MFGRIDSHRVVQQKSPTYRHRRHPGRDRFLRPHTRGSAAHLTGILCLLFLLVSSVSRAAESPEAQVVEFSPQGTVKQVRQVHARFSEPMVPLGDPRGAVAPFDIECSEPGTARWMASGEWVYDFARDLPAGLRCTFRLRAGLTTLAGRPLAEHAFTFSTGGPAVKTIIPRAGAKAIDEEQAFLVVLDAEATPDSIRDHVWIGVAGHQDRLPMKMIIGEAREQILKAQDADAVQGPVVILQATRPFPNEARVTFTWGKGVTSTSGVRTEQDQTFAFQVRKPFTAQFTCERENPRAGCIPVTPMRLTFSAPIAWELASRIALVGPGDRRWGPAPPKTPQVSVQGITFPGPLPETTGFRLTLPPLVVDDANRPLSNAGHFPLTVRTEAFPPLGKFSARFGILERADPVLPVTLRNLEPEVRTRLLRVDKEPLTGVGGSLQYWFEGVKGRLWRIPPERAREIVPWLRRVADAQRETSVFGTADAQRKEFAIPKPSGAKPFEVVGIALEGPGLYVVELESAKLGAALLDKPQAMYVPTAALVTNLAVHFKWGQEQSLVWVTALDTGRPVSGARVTIQDCAEKLLWSGETDPNGIARMSGLPKGWETTPRCDHRSTSDPFERYPYSQTEAIRNFDRGLFVIAQTKDDLSFVHSSWEQGIEPWRFRLPYDDPHDSTLAHTIFDRSLLRAGETLHMKHVLRRQTLGGFATVPADARPTRLTLQHLGSEQKYDLPLTWDAGGIAETTWEIPKDAKLGSYHVVMMGGGTHNEGWVAGGFRVEEFRLALTRGVIRLPAEPQVAATEVTADLSVQYLAGGAARELPVTVRAVLQPKPIPPIDTFEDFTFANGPIAEGIVSRQQEYFGEESEGGEETEGGGESEEGDAPRERLPVRPAIHQREQLTLDAAGTARTTIRRLPRVATPQELLTEMEYPDPNGEIRTVAARVPLWPAEWLAGIQPESWVSSKEQLKAWVAVVDVARRPVAGAPVRVTAFERKLYSHRKRLVGGFYAYEHVEQIRRLADLCTGQTDLRGRFLCEQKPPTEGNLILVATVTDHAGNENATHQDVWVPGAEAWWFRAQDSDRMDVLPEKRKHEPNETARLQVRMPFREATALITVEREGVLDAFVTSLSGTEPVVELPVKPTYAPNVFVSVLAVRGRVGGVQPTALVDLGKPAFKLGIAEIQVGWRGPRAARRRDLRSPRLPRARQGGGEDRRAHRRREDASAGKRGGRGGGGRGAAGADAQPELESPGADDAAARVRRQDGHGPDAGRRKAPLRPEGAPPGRGRRSSGHPGAVRHAALLEGARPTGCTGRGQPRDPAERCAHQLPDRRRGHGRDRPLWNRSDHDPRDSRSDADGGSSPPGPRGGSFPGSVHTAQRDWSPDGGPRPSEDRRRPARPGASDPPTESEPGDRRLLGDPRSQRGERAEVRGPGQREGRRHGPTSRYRGSSARAARANAPGDAPPTEPAAHPDGRAAGRRSPQPRRHLDYRQPHARGEPAQPQGLDGALPLPLSGAAGLAPRGAQG